MTVQACDHDVPTTIDKDRASTNPGKRIPINKMARFTDGLRLAEDRLAAQPRVHDILNPDRLLAQ